MKPRTSNLKEKKEDTFFSEEMLKKLDPKKVPQHIAIIMDGNRRWANSNKFSAFLGHSKGADNLTPIVQAAAEIGIKVVTVFAFSTENWQRSKNEIDHLIQLFEKYLVEKREFLKKNNVKIQMIGDISAFPKSLQKVYAETQAATCKGNKITLVLALNYGAKDEMIRAVKKILMDYDQKKINKNEINEKKINNYLDTANLPDPDLIIRTSGEKRLSNFLLWQSSYSEIYFVDVLWPDFSVQDLFYAVRDYQKRKRRRGGT